MQQEKNQDIHLPRSGLLEPCHALGREFRCAPLPPVSLVVGREKIYLAYVLRL